MRWVFSYKFEIELIVLGEQKEGEEIPEDKKLFVFLIILNP